MQRAAIERAAERLAEARLACRRVGHLPADLRPADESAAYAVQDALHARLGAAGHGAVAGWKIGCTTPVMQRYLGIANPCAGGIFAPAVHRGAASVAHADLLRPGVECEIAVALALDLPVEAAPHEPASVARAVGALMAAIEIVDDRYDDYRTFDTPTLIADDFFNAGCVLGPPVADWQALDLAALAGRMRVNGVEVGSGRSGDILGHPFRALAWLANALNARGRHLRAGEVVLLGSVVQTVWVEPGDRVEVELQNLGRVEVAFR